MSYGELINPVETTTDIWIALGMGGEPQPSKGTDILLIVFIIVAALCLIINLIFIIILFQIQKRPFYRLVWQIVLASILSIIGDAGIYIYVEASKTIISTPERTVYLRYLPFFYYADEVGFHSQFWFTFIIALQRTVMFLFPGASQSKHFNKIWLIIIFLNWIFCCSTSGYITLNGCAYRESVFPACPFQYSCENPFMRVDLLKTIQMLEVIIMPTSTFLLYTIIFGEIIRKRKNIMRIQKNEIMILKQAIVLFLANTLFSIATYVMLIATPTELTHLVRRIVKMFEMIVGGITLGLVYATSKEIRQGVDQINPLRKFWTVRAGNIVSSNE